MYAVVCSGNTALLWPKAVAKLKDKYEAQWPGKVHVVMYEHSSTASGSTKDGSFTSALGVLSSLAQLSQLRPHFSCFLTHFSECSKAFVQNVNRLTRELDPSHPYSDTIWGILTGFCEDDVLAALDLKYLSVRRVIANCPVDLEKFKTGVWFSEFDRGVSYRKLSDLEQFVKELCPDDTTELIAQEIGSERLFYDKSHPVEKGVDMIISSGHASERDWHITYSFEGGTFHSIEGQLSGSTVLGGHVNICWNKNPKILCASGNCLMAHIVDRHCMALGWMHSANVVQMVGYVEPTWFGYGGWGVNKYFINNPGAKSLAESFFANQQSLLHRLHTRFEEHLGMRVMDHCAVYGDCFNTSASGLPKVPRECSGLVYDRDTVVLYGDPAWRAELETNPEVDHYRYSGIIHNQNYDKKYLLFASVSPSA